MKKNRKKSAAPPPGLPPEEKPPVKEQPKKQPFLKRLLFGEETPDLSELEAGSTTILDILSPTSVDTKSRDYIVVDGIFHAYLYITGYGYSTTVGASWLAPLVEAGEGVSISFHFDKQSKEKILAKISQQTMMNRSRMRDVADTRQDFEELDMGPFLGSFYGSCSQSSKLREDNVLAYDPPGDISMTITKDNGSSFPWPVLTDMSKSSIYSKYMTFLGGDHPLVTITNNDLPDGPNCVVIKDSFGNPFAPYLSQHYHNVYVIDYRKYSEMTLSYFVQYYDIDDVLLTESLAMAQGSGTLDLLEWFCK